MSLHKVNVLVSLTEINCGECGGTYAINERYRELQQEQGGTWNCPYCKCGWGYSDNNDNSRLKKEKAKLEKRLQMEKNRREAAENESKHHKNVARSEKAAKTRIKNRIKNGVCPCCNRTFQNLASHMQNKHPDYVKEKNSE